MCRDSKIYRCFPRQSHYSIPDCFRVSTTGTGIYCSSGEGPTTTQINRKTGCQSHWGIICWYLNPGAGEGPREAPAHTGAVLENERGTNVRTLRFRVREHSGASLRIALSPAAVARCAEPVAARPVRRCSVPVPVAPPGGFAWSHPWAGRGGAEPWRRGCGTARARGGRVARGRCPGVPSGAERGVGRTPRYSLRLLHTQRRRLLQRRGRAGPGGGAAALPSPCGAYPPVLCAGRFAGAGTSPLL